MRKVKKEEIYILENLGCAHCGSKMEQKIKELSNVEQAVLVFATKKLQVVTYNEEDILPELQRICEGIESGVVVKRRGALRQEERKEDDRKKETVLKKQKKEILKILIGIALFLFGLVMENYSQMGASVVFVLAYIILGRNIVWTALKNIKKGLFFDEHFLMSIATIAAFAIGDFAEAVGVMLFYRIGDIFEEIAVEKSRGQIMDAIDMRPEVVQYVHGSHVDTIPAEQAKVGDIILVRAGDRVPLDGVVIEGSSRLDTSPVTGESVPVKVERGDGVISGCMNLSGVIKIKVEKILQDSMVSRIMDSVENAAASKPKIDKFITKFARIYTPFVVLLAITTAIIPSLITGQWSHWIYVAITFLVISCPCALVLSVPLAFFAGIGAGSKKGILFKGGIVMEALNQVQTVVMDKTGTITKGNFVVQKCINEEGFTKDQILQLAAESEQRSTHPIAFSIIEEAKKQNLLLKEPKTVTEHSGYGMEVVTEEGKVLCGNMKLMEMFKVDMTTWKSVGFGTEVFIALDGVFAGYIIIADTIKEEAKSAIQGIKKLGIKTVMLTGDTIESANLVAKETGIDEVHAKLLPEDKVTELLAIRSQRPGVMFVGDGINDAPVLAGADIGAAMGSGADAAIEAADIVFMTSSMEAIGQSLEIARFTNLIAKQNVIFALTIKAVVMILGLAGFANMWMAVFADTGVAMLCVLNAVRILRKK